MPWLTPDLQEWGFKCHQILLPDDEKLRAAFRGAFYELSHAHNWEQYGTATPIEIAELFLSIESTNTVLPECVTPEGAIMPIGTVFWFSSDVEPDGCLICDGSLHNADDFPILYAVLGTRWGGDGNTFAVPDLRGRFLRSLDSGSNIGDTGGAEQVALDVAELPEHDHPVHAQVAPGGDDYSNPVLGWRPSPYLLTGTRGDGEPHENLPPYEVLVAMIRAE